jgi:two-component system, LuxR family, sensor kinase FixL
MSALVTTPASRFGKILIVEDEALIAQDIEAQLTQLGYEVCGIAVSGEQAIQAASLHRPDIALMDIMLRGDIDGIQAAEAIDQRHQIPVIFLTAHADEHTLQRAKLTKPLGYITKPFTERELSTALEIGLYREAMRRQVRDANAALRISEARWRTMIETAVDAIIVTDAQGVIQTLNPAAERIFGYETQDIIGRNISLLMPELPCVVAADSGQRLEASDEQMKGVRRQVEGKRRDGATIWLDLGIAAWWIDGTQYVTGTMRDITDRKRIEEKLVQRNDELARANAKLDQFAYIISHDLRAPLRAMRNSARWIAEDAVERLDEGTSTHLERIATNCQRMFAMLDDLLEYARAGLVSFVPEPINLPELLAEITGHLEGAEIDLIFAGPVRSVHAARAGLDVVLRNLIDNAVRHCGGTVRVAVRCHDVGPLWRFEVEDDGPGIPAEYQQRVFMPFVKVHPKKTAGTGMGLALVSRVIEDNGGTIGVRSDPATGRGTTMVFTWAKQAPRDQDPA